MMAPYGSYFEKLEVTLKTNPKRGNSAIRTLKVNKFGRITSVVDNLFFLRNSLAYGRQIYFYRLKLTEYK